MTKLGFEYMIKKNADGYWRALKRCEDGDWVPVNSEFDYGWYEKVHLTRWGARRACRKHAERLRQIEKNKVTQPEYLGQL